MTAITPEHTALFQECWRRVRGEAIQRFRNGERFFDGTIMLPVPEASAIPFSPADMAMAPVMAERITFEAGPIQYRGRSPESFHVTCRGVEMEHVRVRPRWSVGDEVIFTRNTQQAAFDRLPVGMFITDQHLGERGQIRRIDAAGQIYHVALVSGVEFLPL